MSAIPCKMPPRIFLYPKDVENITGLSDRTARSIVQRIKQTFGKSSHQFVTVKEFCLFYGIDEELIRDFLKY